MGLFVTNCLFFNVFQSGFDIVAASNNLTEFKVLPSQIIHEINGLIAKIVFSGLFSYSLHRFSFLWFERTTPKEIKDLDEGKGFNPEIKEDCQKLEEALTQLQFNHIEILQELRDTIQQNNDKEEEIEALKSRLTRKKSPKEKIKLDPIQE